MKHSSVFGIYHDRATAEDAVAELRRANFPDSAISMLVPDNVGSKDFAHEKHTKAPEGAVAGGGTGAVLGAAVGWLAGAGSLMIPGLETLTSVGPMVAAFSGVGVGVVLGGVTGGLFGLGIPEYEAKRYEGRIRHGGILLSVHCPDPHWTGPAQSILRRTGATDIGIRSTNTHVRREHRAHPETARS